MRIINALKKQCGGRWQWTGKQWSGECGQYAVRQASGLDEYGDITGSHVVHFSRDGAPTEVFLQGPCGANPNCEICGRFISWLDVHTGAATYRMITPDSDVSSEEWEILCVKCTLKRKESNET